ncbi:MAG: hypothetical protein FJX89_09100 [Bacteroidetes bacterium]|nr:hypothetical protein [Bacteroidota bacterium]
MNQTIKKGKKSTEKDHHLVKDPIQFFIENKRDGVWGKNKEKWKTHFRLQLKVLKLFIDNQADEKHLVSFVYRLGLGYWGVGKQSGIPSGILSLNAVTSENTKKTDDHFIGAQLIGKTVHEAYEACDFNEGHMVDHWLYENLWLWMTIKVTQEEHRSGILKTVDGLELKKRMEHYVNVSPLVTLKKR